MQIQLLSTMNWDDYHLTSKWTVIQHRRPRHSVAWCHRMSRSAMLPEVHRLVHTFDNFFVIDYAQVEWLGRREGMKPYVGGRLLVSIVAKKIQTFERRLYIFVSVLKESDAVHTSNLTGWISGRNKLASVLKKKLLCWTKRGGDSWKGTSKR